MDSASSKRSASYGSDSDTENEHCLFMSSGGGGGRAGAARYGPSLSIDIDGVAETESEAPTLVQERLVLCAFELPDGSIGEETFKLGHTVEFIKSFVESEYGIPMFEQVSSCCFTYHVYLLTAL